MSISVQVNSNNAPEIFRVLQALEFTADQRRKLNFAIGEELVSQVLLRFDEQKDPEGQFWPVSGRAFRESGETMQDTRTLMNSYTHNEGPDFVEVGTNVPYARIHQFGGEIKAKSSPYLWFNYGGRWAKKKSVTIPRRAMLGINEENANDIFLLVDKFIRKQGGVK